MSFPKFMQRLWKTQILAIIQISKRVRSSQTKIGWISLANLSMTSLNSILHTYFKHIPWLTEKTIGISDTRLQLHNEIIEFHRQFGWNKAEMEERYKCFNNIKTLIQKNYWGLNANDWKLHVFGSSSTGLIVNRNTVKYYNWDISDIDIVVEGKFTHKIIRKILEADGGYMDIESRESAAVPITLGIDRKTGLSFDITINHMDGIKGSNIINMHKKKFKELKYL